ncbi:hypothetical protein QR680_018948 [Steinernema hermaphroditum]|uniref:protein-serine/threonine phosphatase n=1 Tax=Steinernema hermaphroditum TaxID=289476 RepID=A0AA39LRW3_9BILA|nr:hypothetical protein QR680_018948 [Steinernema hermaphroditum]
MCGPIAKKRTESDETEKCYDEDLDDLDVDHLIHRLLNAGSPKTCLTKVVKRGELVQLCQTVCGVFKSQSVMLDLEPPVKICGDIHGQYGDLLRIFDRCGFPPTTNYLFLGNYVDRGRHSLETICLLFAYKVSVNKKFGFYNEVLERYQSVQLFNAFQDAFRMMPLTALITSRILCMHGGLSQKINSLKDLRRIKRPVYVRANEEKKDEKGNQIPTIEHDLLWSNPDGRKGWRRNKKGDVFFGSDVVDEYAKKLNIDLIVTSGQADCGYKLFPGEKLITIFSAPNYQGHNYNAAGVLDVNEKLECSLHIFRRMACPVKRGPDGKQEEELINSWFSNIFNVDLSPTTLATTTILTTTLPPINHALVHLNTGPVEGKEVGDGLAFLGIPYAEPPVGALRFRPPQPKAPWTDQLSVQEYAKSCIFASSLESTDIPADQQSEDCLYLNVFTNEYCIANQQCKVLVYIHGGYHGSTYFKEDVLIENFLGEDRNVIVVTVSYRLGVLGNINLVPEGDTSAARNIALLDIIASLQWVQQQIYYFGGDPLETTVIGHDTGALNVYHLLLSPTYHNLFKQAMLMSGYDLQGEVYPDRNMRSSRAVAEAARCATSSTDYTYVEQSELVVNCLRNYTASDLVHHQLYAEKQGLYFLGNVLDMYILPSKIDDLIAKQSPTNLIVGSSGNENELDNIVNDTVAMDRLRFYCEIVAKERNYKYLTQATADCIRQYNDVHKAIGIKNDAYYFTSAWNVAKANADAGGTSRIYEFSPRKELKRESDHDDLITYLFGYEEGELDETDHSIRSALAKTLTDFINGVDTEEWPVFPSFYLIDYNEEVEISGAQEKYHTEAITFWNEFIERNGNTRIERTEEPSLKAIEDSVAFGGLLVSDRFQRQVVVAVVCVVVALAFIAFILVLVVLTHLNNRDKPESIVFSTRNSNSIRPQMA